MKIRLAAAAVVLASLVACTSNNTAPPTTQPQPEQVPTTEAPPRVTTVQQNDPLLQASAQKDAQAVLALKRPPIRAAQAAPGAELLTNGQLNGTLGFSLNAGGGGTPTYDPAISHTADGSGSVRITRGSYARVNGQQIITLQPGITYTLSAYMRSATPVSGTIDMTGGMVEPPWMLYDGNRQVLTHSAVGQNLVNTWQEITSVISVPVTTNIFFYIGRFGWQFEESGDVWVDDFSVKAGFNVRSPDTTPRTAFDGYVAKVSSKGAWSLRNAGTGAYDPFVPIGIAAYSSRPIGAVGQKYSMANLATGFNTDNWTFIGPEQFTNNGNGTYTAKAGYPLHTLKAVGMKSFMQISQYYCTPAMRPECSAYYYQNYAHLEQTLNILNNSDVKDVVIGFWMDNELDSPYSVYDSITKTIKDVDRTNGVRNRPIVMLQSTDYARAYTSQANGDFFDVVGEYQPGGAASFPRMNAGRKMIRAYQEGYTKPATHCNLNQAQGVTRTMAWGCFALGGTSTSYWVDNIYDATAGVGEPYVEDAGQFLPQMQLLMQELPLIQPAMHADVFSGWTVNTNQGTNGHVYPVASSPTPKNVGGVAHMFVVNQSNSARTITFTIAASTYPVWEVRNALTNALVANLSGGGTTFSMDLPAAVRDVPNPTTNTNGAVLLKLLPNPAVPTTTTTTTTAPVTTTTTTTTIPGTTTTTTIPSNVHDDANTSNWAFSNEYDNDDTCTTTAATSWSRSTTLATITHSTHGFVSGQSVKFTATSDAAALTNATRVITVLNANQYTTAALNAGATSGTIDAARVCYEADGWIKYGSTFGTGATDAADYPPYGTPNLTNHTTNKVGATATYSFNGTRFRIYGGNGPSFGKLTVVIQDLGIVAQLDGYAEDGARGQLIYASNLLPPGDHTVLITANGSQNPLSTGRDVVLDYAVAEGSGTATTTSSTTTTTTTTTIPATPNDTCPVSRTCLFSGNPTPDSVTGGGTPPFTYGIRFTPSASGSITHVRFYRHAGDVSVRKVRLWTAAGTELTPEGGVSASVTTAGWRNVALPSAITVVAGQTYTATVDTTSTAAYPYTYNVFTSAVTSSPLVAPVDAGVYSSVLGQYPTLTYLASSYGVDVVYNSAVSNSSTTTTPPTIGACVPPIGRLSVTVVGSAPSTQFLTDGDAGTTWVSSNEFPQEMVIDLDAPATVSRLYLHWVRNRASGFFVVDARANASAPWTRVSARSGVSTRVRDCMQIPLSGSRGQLRITFQRMEAGAVADTMSLREIAVL